MSTQVITILGSIMIAIALSIDAFVASFAYGTNKIKIPFVSVIVINIVCTGILAISLFFGNLLKNIIPETSVNLMCFFILFIIGFCKLLESVVTSINKRRKIKGNLNFDLIGLCINIRIKSQPEDELCGYKTLMPLEAASIAVALSFDSLAVGIGAAFNNSDNIMLIIFSFVFGMFDVLLGSYLGTKIIEKTSFNLSWLSGVILIILAFMKF
ncbi:MAG: sporulation membrane protein YtaF [Candidatus Paraimprobicoccus trichonymphae]|uniref:Sporulation membrane protein YtaF n=1 Tax=Candidatus Paraimprobicoccus trichonymphae TaxID=3033793 RepID=A0AA48KY54_9FIRM|nr:MAG: sporulation membrane protein YtaF [Candidatus Paraimprobicoccus trichonymphae]